MKNKSVPFFCPVFTEVKTGKRLLIEYLIAPLLRYKMDSVEER